MRNEVVRRLTKLAENDTRVMVVTGDLGFGVLTQFAETFPNQYINAGVAEQNMMAIACGCAMEGKQVFAYSIANFPTLRCLEQIRNDVCYHEADVKILAVGGGFSYGQLGMSHHATEDIAIMRALPNMRVVVPATLWEAAEAVEALARVPGPGYLRIDKSAADAEPRPGEQFILGKARTVRDGGDVTLVTAGGILSEVLKAADKLAEGNILCRVLDMHTIKPLDVLALEKAAVDSRAIVTVEEHSVLGGLGGAVAEALMEMDIDRKRLIFRRIGLADRYPSIVGDQQYLRGLYGMDAAAIENVVRATLKLSPVPAISRSRLSVAGG